MRGKVSRSLTIIHSRDRIIRPGLDKLRRSTSGHWVHDQPSVDMRRNRTIIPLLLLSVIFYLAILAISIGVRRVIKRLLLLWYRTMNLISEGRIRQLFDILFAIPLLLLLLQLAIMIDIPGLLQASEIGTGETTAERVRPLFCFRWGGLDR